MKELLSYWDLSLGLIAIVVGIYKRYKLYINRKYDEISKRKTIGACEFSSYARIKNERLRGLILLSYDYCRYIIYL